MTSGGRGSLQHGSLPERLYLLHHHDDGRAMQHKPDAPHCYCESCIARSEQAAIATDTTLEELSLALTRYTDAGGDLTLVCSGCKATAVMLDGIGPGDAA
jgi:hypothetical protein